MSSALSRALKGKRAVKRFGVGLLLKLSKHLTRSGGRSPRTEAALAEAFRKALVHWVDGGQ
jgi:hypothetical protein